MLLLHIDDLQWGDLDSIALLNDLLAPPDPPHLLLILCYRTDLADPSPVLKELERSGIHPSDEIGVHHMELAALSDADARELAQATLGQQIECQEELCAEIARESGGNPYFIGELARHYAQLGSAPRHGETPEVSLKETLWAGVARLPDRTRQLLEVVAVAGHPLRERDALAAAGLGAEGRRAMADLLAAHVIRTVGAGGKEEIEPYHDRVREAILTRLSDASRQDVHGRLAGVLEASGATDFATLASHFAAAGQYERAGICYVLAADEASRSLAFGSAVASYRLAMEKLPAAEIDRRDLQRKLADALANAGRGAEAAHHYLLAAERVGDDQSRDLRRARRCSCWPLATSRKAWRSCGPSCWLAACDSPRHARLSGPCCGTAVC